MSTAAVSSSSLYQQLQWYFQTRQSDVQQLGQALQSGDLAGAQKAYNAIAQLGQNGPFAHGDAFRVSQREQDFNAIGQALQAGDLAGAQQAFTTLQNTFHSHQSATSGSTAPEPPVVILNIGNTTGATATTPASPAPPTTTADPTTVTPSPTGTAPAAPASPAATSAPEIVINLGGSNSSTPEQVTLSLSNQPNGGEQLKVSVGDQQGSNAEQIILNLAQGSNEQIILNLFNATASPQPQSSGVNVVA